MPTTLVAIASLTKRETVIAILQIVQGNSDGVLNDSRAPAIRPMYRRVRHFFELQRVSLIHPG